MNKILILFSFVLLTACGKGSAWYTLTSGIKGSPANIHKRQEQIQRIADSKPTVKKENCSAGLDLRMPFPEGFYCGGQGEDNWKKRTHYSPKSSGGWRYLVEIYDDNGNLRGKHNYNGRRLWGLSEAYHENGQLRFRGNFEDGELEGGGVLP